MLKKINIITMYAIKSKKCIHFLGATCMGLSIYWHHFLTKIWLQDKQSHLFVKNRANTCLIISIYDGSKILILKFHKL